MYIHVYAYVYLCSYVGTGAYTWRFFPIPMYIHVYAYVYLCSYVGIGAYTRRFFLYVHVYAYVYLCYYVGIYDDLQLLARIEDYLRNALNSPGTWPTNSFVAILWVGVDRLGTKYRLGLPTHNQTDEIHEVCIPILTLVFGGINLSKFLRSLYLPIHLRNNKMLNTCYTKVNQNAFSRESWLWGFSLCSALMYICTWTRAQNVSQRMFYQNCSITFTLKICS
jgi:hypothetical protein